MNKSIHYKYSLRELELGIGYKGSYHSDFSSSAYIAILGLDPQLSEGDIISVFSQYGEVIDFVLIREQDTGVSKGKAFLCYQDQRSTILAVDNLNNLIIGTKQISVNHVKEFSRRFYPLDEEETALETDPNYIPLNSFGLPLLYPNETSPQPWANWDPESDFETNKYIPPLPKKKKLKNSLNVISLTDLLNQKQQQQKKPKKKRFAKKKT